MQLVRLWHLESGINEAIYGRDYKRSFEFCGLKDK